MKYRILHIHLIPSRFDVEMKKWYWLKWKFVSTFTSVDEAVEQIEIQYRYKKPFSIVQPFRV